ncbi:UPF0553 protein C9orf64 [Acipenser ruthenus]|uniref:Queuosine 5'-phosphate N-glycosylase/hydrolase n=1 Tax=Acipenser ruthenus TaxID=7906 RepID=A0A444UAW6_ACIRT|nr:UPF0553 protein C9orf64 [Acipenser ruthenus]
MIKLIVETIPSNRDKAAFEGKNVAFYKRAQILVEDFWDILEAGGAPDIGYLTMFTDYRVPQAIVYQGALRYSSELTKTIKEGVILASGDRQEVEIRGCSIWCVERIREQLWDVAEQREGFKLEHVNSAVIDVYLWPRCIYY